MKRFYSLSIAAHVGLLILAAMLASQQGGKGSGGEGSGGDDGSPSSNFIPKPLEVEVVMAPTPTDKGEGDVPPPPPVKPERTCLNDLWYGGIGIQTDWDGVVRKLAPGYSAERAGILLGDRIVSEEEIRGEPGTTVIVVVVRPSTNETLSFNIERERVCYEE